MGFPIDKKNINERIDFKITEYISKTGHDPKYLIMNLDDYLELEKHTKKNALVYNCGDIKEYRSLELQIKIKGELKVQEHSMLEFLPYKQSAGEFNESYIRDIVNRGVDIIELNKKNYMNSIELIDILERRNLIECYINSELPDELVIYYKDGELFGKFESFIY